MKAKKGFTLVEILIVVVILGILAAIVIPQFTGASVEAKVSSVKSDLQSMRSQIELYKLQHNEALPGAGGGSAADFESDMTDRTDVDGNVWAAGAGTAYGPYMQKLPTNPLNNLSTVRYDGADAGADTHGWRFDSTTGEFNPDDAYDGDDDGTIDHIQHDY